MKWLALIALPLVAFMVAYSLDAGCFICLYGEEEGGAVEKWINACFAAAVLAAVTWLLWWKRRR